MQEPLACEIEKDCLQAGTETSCEDAIRRASPVVANLLERALCGESLGFADGRILANVDGAELTALIKAADELRRRAVGDVITYVVNRNMNFTNVCTVGCSFCGFSRSVNSPDAYFHSNRELVERARDAVARGATEVCIQGGLPRDLDGFYYRNLLRDLKQALPHLHCHAFSPMEISFGVERTGLPLREYLVMLKEAGLGSVPGTAAEILDDAIRRRLSPNKLAAAQWVEIIRAAHQLGIPSTSTMMYGHVENPDDWVRHILLLREIQKETHGFTEFVPLGFIHTKTRLFQIGGARPGSSLRETLIVHALARILLHGYIKNIQVSWVKLGMEISSRCLKAGANDFGGTLMEESISKSAGAQFGEYVSPEEFQSAIFRIGRIPAERSTTYKILRKFEAGEAEPNTPPSWPKHKSVPSAAAYTGTGY